MVAIAANVHFFKILAMLSLIFVKQVQILAIVSVHFEDIFKFHKYIQQHLKPL